MAMIIPRWEWRTFARHFEVAEKHFAELTPAGIQESDELYLLGGTGENVKIRDDLLDIKVLREVDAAGLERWEPVMKKGFPLPKADVVSVFASLHLAAPELARETYTREQFLDELIASQAVVRPVRLHKRRVRYTIGGCTS